MPRDEFTRKTRREALLRAAGFCEATGKLYGLPSGQRCNAPLGYSFQFDHVILAANGGDGSLENCAVVCAPCHRTKTARHDTPLAAKTQRQQDKDRGIKGTSSRPVPGSRGTKWRKKMDGTVERRA